MMAPYSMEQSLLCTQACTGRFHHFHLARQLEKHHSLYQIVTGYPHSKLKDEAGIPRHKIHSYPWLQTPYMAALSRLNLSSAWPWLDQEWAWWAHEALDRHVAGKLGDSNVLIALSCSGLTAGRAMHKRGGLFICDRGSSHICYQDNLLREEARLWGFPYRGIDPRKLAKEEQEYAEADQVLVPSSFAYRSFIEKGVPSDKITRVPYGANLSRFSRQQCPDKNAFRVLFVGQISLRKGIPYLLQAFHQLKHPNKELLMAGGMTAEIESLISNGKLPVNDVKFVGTVKNSELAKLYSSAHAFVLPSIEEGLALVQGEALACGCPVIATRNTGAEDLFEDGREGFIVPIRDSDALLMSLQRLADEPELRDKMSDAAIQRTKAIGGWDTYGDNVVKLLNDLMRRRLA